MSFYSAHPILFGIGVSGTTSSLGVNDPEVGTRIRSGDEDYIFVYNTGASTATVGHACVLSAVTGYSVTVSSTTSADMAVGVVKHSDIEPAAYGWLVCKGFTSIEMGATSGTVAAGGLVHLADDGKFVPVSNATGSKDNVVGKAMEAIVSNASGQAYISLI